MSVFSPVNNRPFQKEIQPIVQEQSNPEENKYPEMC